MEPLKSNNFIQFFLKTGEEHDLLYTYECEDGDTLVQEGGFYILKGEDGVIKAQFSEILCSGYSVGFHAIEESDEEAYEESVGED